MGNVYGLISYIRLLRRPEFRSLFVGSLLTFTLILVALGFQLSQSYQSELREAGRNAGNLAEVLEVQTIGSFRALDVMLLSLAESAIERAASANHTTPLDPSLFKQVVAKFPEVTGVRLFDKKGICLQAAGSSDCSFSVEDRDFFKRHANEPATGLIISKPFLSKLDGQWLIALSRRISDKAGNFQGVIVTGLPLSNFQNLYQKVDIGSTGNVTIFSADDYTLMLRHPTIQSLIGKSFAQAEFFKTIRQRPETSGALQVRSVADGEMKLYTYRVVSSLNLVIVVGLGEKEILQAWWLKSWALGGFVVLTLALFAYLVLHYLRSQDVIETGRLQLVKSAKMSALGEMASAVAHEINNPLAIISGHANMLRDLSTTSEADGKLLALKVDKIEGTVSRIAKIVSGLKSFSRSGDEDPFELCDLGQIVDQTLEMCRSKLQNQDVELQIDIGSLRDLSVQCRGVQISQTLLNLISNASDAVVDKSERWIKIEAVLVHESIRLTVTDSGRGIPSQIAESMMQPFFTTKEVGRGTGLGLSISKGLIEEHGGSLKYDSTFKNTRFILTLPLRQLAPTRGQAAPTRSRVG